MAKVTITLEGDAGTLASLLVGWREGAVNGVAQLEKSAEMAQGAPRHRASIMRYRDTCEAVASRLSDALRTVDVSIDGGE